MLHLFEGFGVEIEYMIVDRDTLTVKPIADRIFAAVNGTPTTDLTEGRFTWSNELVNHVVELKLTEPTASLTGLGPDLNAQVRSFSEKLASFGAMLMPGAMHPLMVPEHETVLWPGDYSDTYQAFDRIFDCRGHGWSNLQSTHLNLSFSGDEEFRRLHSAIRFLLPVIPALSASSPIEEGRLTGFYDNRLRHYAENCIRVPSVTAGVVPIVIRSIREYETKILQTIYDDMVALDPDGELRYEWVNARGVTGKFEQGSLEIRIIDSQECPAADLAILHAVQAVIRSLIDAGSDHIEELEAYPQESLFRLYNQAVKDGDGLRIEDGRYLALLGLSGSNVRGRDLWTALCAKSETQEHQEFYTMYGRYGCLARRMVDALRMEAGQTTEELFGRVREMCRRMGADLVNGTFFIP